MSDETISHYASRVDSATSILEDVQEGESASADVEMEDRSEPAEVVVEELPETQRRLDLLGSLIEQPSPTESIIADKEHLDNLEDLHELQLRLPDLDAGLDEEIADLEEREPITLTESGSARSRGSNISNVTWVSQKASVHIRTPVRKKAKKRVSSLETQSKKSKSTRSSSCSSSLSPRSVSSLLSFHEKVDSAPYIVMKAKKKTRKQSLHKKPEIIYVENSPTAVSEQISLTDYEDPFLSVQKREGLMGFLKAIPRIEDLSEMGSIEWYTTQRLMDHGTRSSGISGPTSAAQDEGHGYEECDIEDFEFDEAEEEQEGAKRQKKVKSNKGNVEEGDSSSMSTESSSQSDGLSFPSLTSVTQTTPALLKKTRVFDEFDVAKSMIESECQQPDQQTRISSTLYWEAFDMCRDFLDETINQIVHTLEQEGAGKRRRFDRRKLVKELCWLNREADQEHDINKCLQKAMHEFFVRKKQWTYIDNPKRVDLMNFERSKDALVGLDRLLLVEKELLRRVNIQSSKASEDLDAALEDSEQKVRDLEQTMRSTLLFNNNFKHLADTLEAVLGNMAKFRDELGQLRLDLLLTQHRLAEIKNQSAKIEHVDSGLTIASYLSQQTEATVLEGKIAERNAEMNRLHSKITLDMHAMAHVKCKEHMSRRTFNELKDQLKEREAARNRYRQLIHQEKLKRSKLHRELQEIRFSSSLIQHPNLIMDYCNTEEYITAKREAVEKLRLEHKRLSRRISNLESRRATLVEQRKSSAIIVSSDPSFKLSGISIL